MRLKELVTYLAVRGAGYLFSFALDPILAARKSLGSNTYSHVSNKIFTHTHTLTPALIHRYGHTKTILGFCRKEHISLKSHIGRTLKCILLKYHASLNLQLIGFM